MIIIGCDPGLTGAISLIDPARGLLECADIPTCANGQASGSMKNWVNVRSLAGMLSAWAHRYDLAAECVHGVIERPIPMPSLPAQTIASQFDTFGAIRAVLTAKVQELFLVNPQEWQKLYGLGKGDKDKSRQVCQRLYPTAPVTRVKDHNRAESVLIAHWHMRVTQ